MAGSLHVVDHPAVADRLARLRDAATTVGLFRRLVEELGLFLAYEATADLPTAELSVRTPMGEAPARRLAAPPPVVAPILRAGLGLLQGFLAVVEEAEVAHLGFYRDPQTLAAVPYYANLPADLGARRVFVIDPMLATGNSAVAALDVLASRGAAAMTLVCLIAAPEGVANVHGAHPGTRVVTASLDERLNEHGYIVPGLGDAGDRMFGSATSVPTMVRPA
ncbi:MAG TPA: uracil phosphoribosyltransferase [Candidatus Dormibacteraeota bacterium]|nr:uracil phosphoribosyltransferase [Candidatus Dormibacteraeota bacterium]